MTRDDGHGRISSFASSSSGRSDLTVTPSRATSIKHTAHLLKTADNIQPRTSRDDTQISPTTTGALSPNLAAPGSSGFDSRRLSNLANYRRDLAVLDPSGGRVPHIHKEPPSAGPSDQVAPWMSGNDGAASANPPSATFGTSFFNDSSDNVSTASQLSPAFRQGSSIRPSQTTGSSESTDTAFFNDERRPSVASVTTASSQGSKHSGNRGGIKKLQGFFGEEFPGRDGSEVSLPAAVAKDQRSFSFNRTHGRERNYSNATDHTRDASPSSSRPRTPVPSSDVVPFLYQESGDIAKYGEAPVREMLSGPDRERYQDREAQGQQPPKTSSSNRSGHSAGHLPGHNHRHNKSNDDTRSLRPVVSREESLASVNTMKERGGSTVSVRTRAQSPTPSLTSNLRMASVDGQTSPGHHGKRGIFDRLRRHMHKEDHSSNSRLRELPPSSRSLNPSTSRSDLRADSISVNKPLPPIDQQPESAMPRPAQPRQAATFNNKFPFSKKGRSHRPYDEEEEFIGPTDRNDNGKVFHLDTNLENMDGILAHPPLLTPMDPTMFQIPEVEKPPEPVLAASGQDVQGAWNAPDSWAVRKNAEEQAAQEEQNEDAVTLPKPEEKKAPHCIRVFRIDGTFVTIQLPLDATVSDVMTQVVKKTYVSDGLENYHIILKKHDFARVLAGIERPLLIQKRLLQQVGYEEKDRLEDIGREDNSYLCRFLFRSARDTDFLSVPNELNQVGRNQKLNHIDLSGRNLVTIPITLYSRTADIISLNLSRNLSLDVPRDFIQACPQLRDIKFANNEARKLPISISRAKRLTYLDVSNNRLEELEHADLSGLTGLLKFNLSNNRLNSLPEYFDAFKALRSLNLSSNFLENFPPFLCSLESLVDIDVSFNSIANLPVEIGQMRNLEKFVMTNNRLTGALPSTFSNLSNLRELDLKYNTLTSIDVISELPKLEILSADHNKISQFIGSFEKIRNLKLNANPITKFDLVGPVPTLKVLILANAQLASVDGSFNNLTNLERLVLDKNYFVSLPNTIGNMRRLEHFSIANNSVGELPPEIGCLTELKVLDVRGNNIKRLPSELWWANKLETLNASSNVLDNFPKPASRPPQAPGESATPPISNGKNGSGTLSQNASVESLLPDGSRRPSQASSNLLSIGPSPVPAGSDRKGSVVSVYGKGGRKTSVVSRSTTGSTNGTPTIAPSLASRKDSGLSGRLMSTFAGSLRHLYLADNQLDDDAFDQITLLSELRTLNMSYNDLTDMPQRSIKSWPQLVELYLSGNDLTSLPFDDLEETSLMQVLHINGNKFTNLPADISRAKKLAVLDCGNNSLKYNISNVPYDWNWNLNPNLRYLNLSGNKRLEIKQTNFGPGTSNREQYTDFSRLLNLRILGLMDVTLTTQQPSIPDQSEDRRVRTSGSLAGNMPYGMADAMGRNEHLSTIDLVVPRFNSSDTETLMGMFDGQALSSGGSKIAKYLHENFGHIFAMELKALKKPQGETPSDALRRAFLSLNKDLVTIAYQHTEERPSKAHRGSAAPLVLSQEDLNSGGVATVAYLRGEELYIANVGDVQAMLIQTDGSHKMLTRKHDPAEPSERQRIREAGGWVSRQGRLNDALEVSRAFGYVDLMPAVQAAPHVSQMTITSQDDTMLIATRELWEYLSPGLIVDVTRSERGDLMRASQKLRDLAIAYGATSKIMIMMLSVSDLKRRQERAARLHRGQSMSLYPSGIPEELQYPAKRGRRKGEVQDSTLHRLEAEVPAPTDKPSIVFTDIKNSTNLWEVYPSAMRSAIKLHNEVMRRQLRRVGGYEVKTEGDAFMVSFPTATSALLWCFTIQNQLMEVDWPTEVLNSVTCQEVYDKEENLIFKGLSVRMGIHVGETVAEVDPVTRRMDYFGPMVNKASRISAVADGGQITASADFISEIQRSLETHQESERNGSLGSEEGFDDEPANVIRRDLRALTSMGFELKELGERKLKGLENPEMIYALYPHALAGRIEYHNQDPRAKTEVAKPATLQPGGQLGVDPDTIWALWKVSLRMEMLCSSLEEASGRGLQPPETELLERMKQRGGEVTEAFLCKFMEHQVSRIETCVTTLSLRHIAIGSGPIERLDDLRTPMPAILDDLGRQLALLAKYKAKFGELSDEDDDGSDTEQE